MFLLFSINVAAAETSEIETIKTAIKNKYQQQYPSLAIQELQVTPFGKMPRKFTDYHIEKIFISAASLKRNRGTFSVLYANPQQKKKRFFKFFLKATIGVYVSTHPLSKSQTINPHYVRYKNITFKSFPFRPIDESYFDDYSLKRSFKEGKMITINDLKRVLDIKRGQIIDATLTDNNIILNFKVKAMQEGNIGDIIRVKKGHYKKFNAQIISKSRVEIIE